MHIEEGILLSHFRILKRIGVGGMSEVWLALDTRLDREVALKLLPENLQSDPTRRTRLENEAKAIAALNHPNIVVAHSIEEAADCLFIAMELVRGTTLDRLIPPHGFPVERFFSLAIPICDAVGAAHEHGITHRDIKPRNIMVTREGLVKILDFGLASPPELPRSSPPEEAPTENLTIDHRLTGTLAYMAPEQLEGVPPDFRSDIFSLGIVLHQMAGGRLPFCGRTPAQMIASIMKSEPAALTELNPEVPRHLSRVVRWCLEKDPARRIASARELCEELRTLRRSRISVPGDPGRTLAVLPFRDMSPDQDQRYFSEGIAEDILKTLSAVEDIHVAPRTSSFRYKSEEIESPAIGKHLGVGALLLGSVQRTGDRIRIAANLVEAQSGNELWSGKYERELRHVFSIQDEIVQHVVQALKGTLSPRERRILMQVATADVRAYDYYLRGRSHYCLFHRRGIQFALQMYSRAVEIDPAYALAYAGIADCCSFLFTYVERCERNRLDAEEASLRALEFDPYLAEAHVARALALSNSGRHEEADVEFGEAEVLDPRLFEAFYYHARESFARGYPEKAIALYRRAHDLHPEDYQPPLLIAQIYEDQGRPVEARESRLLGLRLAEERLDRCPDDTRALYMGANGLVALGERVQGLEWARRALEGEPDEPMLLYNLACIYSLAGEVEPALDLLERAVEGGFAHREWIMRDSDLDAVRDRPRYAAILEIVGA